jgi:hypothetical protein
MNIKRSSLAAAVTALLAFGASQPAMADIYAGASLDIQNLVITLGGSPGVTGFTFTVNNFAQLNNGTPASSGNSCAGTVNPAAVFPAPVVATSCGAGPVLQAPVANAPGGTHDRLDNDFTFFGPSVGQTFSNSDSQIDTAQVVQGVPSSTRQISEAELAGTGNALTNTTVNSNTTFRLDFIVPATAPAGEFRISFDADPDLFVSVNTAALQGSPFAQASTGATLALTGFGPSGPTSVSWTPNGNAAPVLAQDCIGAGIACTELADSQNLNRTLTLPPVNPSFNAYSDNRGGAFSPDPTAPALTAPLTHFEFVVTGLSAGAYSLGLTATTGVNLTQTVPEPGILGLMGIGLLGLIGAGRRKKLA